MQENPLEGKVLFITGGARRIGAVVCRLLHAEGMRLVIHYRRSAEPAQRLRQALEALRPGSVALLQADLLAPGRSWEAVAAEARDAFGRLDALVHNASSFYPTPLGEAGEAQWEDLLGTNLKAPFFLSQACAPELRARGGNIVSIADIHAERPLAGHSLYSIAKAGLVMMTRALARELAPQVRVNAIAPGAILWPEGGDEAARAGILAGTPLGRIGQPEDIARTVRFLLRDAHYITGQVISVCGGRSITL